MHEQFDGRPAKPWAAGEARVSKIVFIGKDLDEGCHPQGLQRLLCPVKGFDFVRRKVLLLAVSVADDRRLQSQQLHL